jgi:hypothetical protein
MDGVSDQDFSSSNPTTEAPLFFSITFARFRCPERQISSSTRKLVRLALPLKYRPGEGFQSRFLTISCRDPVIAEGKVNRKKRGKKFLQLSTCLKSYHYNMKYVCGFCIDKC